MQGTMPVLQRELWRVYIEACSLGCGCRFDCATAVTWWRSIANSTLSHCQGAPTTSEARTASLAGAALGTFIPPLSTQKSTPNT